MWSNWVTKIIDTASLPSCPVELTPTQAATWIAANLVVDGVPVVTWSPKLPLGQAALRAYTIYGKTNLTDSAWHSPTNEASQFFKVGVEMR